MAVGDHRGGGGGGGGFAFVSAFSEAHELQDDVLRQVGAMFDPQHLPAASAEAPMADQESRVVVQLLPAPGADAGRASTRATPVFPSTLADGMQTARAGKYDYRVWVRTLADGQRIAVAQETAVRNETARNSALHTVMPFLILVPILLLYYGGCAAQDVRADPPARARGRPAR